MEPPQISEVVLKKLGNSFDESRGLKRDTWTCSANVCKKVWACEIRVHPQANAVTRASPEFQVPPVYQDTVMKPIGVTVFILGNVLTTFWTIVGTAAPTSQYLLLFLPAGLAVAFVATTFNLDPGMLPKFLERDVAVEAVESGASEPEDVGLRVSPEGGLERVVPVAGPPGACCLVAGAEPPVEDYEKYCWTCNNWRPPRTTHCSLCGGCFRRFDHHCTVLGTCIGQDNYLSFLLFLASASFAVVYVTSINIAHFSNNSGADPWSEHWTRYLLVVQTMLLLLTNIWTFFTLFHFVMFLCDVTSKQMLHRRGSFVMLLWQGLNNHDYRRHMAEVLCPRLRWKWGGSEVYMASREPGVSTSVELPGSQQADQNGQGGQGAKYTVQTDSKAPPLVTRSLPNGFVGSSSARSDAPEGPESGDSAWRSPRNDGGSESI